MARYLFIWPFIRAAVAQPLVAGARVPGEDGGDGEPRCAGAGGGVRRGGGDASLDRYNASRPGGGAVDVRRQRACPSAGGGELNMNPINPVGPFAEKMSEAYGISQRRLHADRRRLEPRPYDRVGQGRLRRPGHRPEGDRRGSTPSPRHSYYRALTKPKASGARRSTPTATPSGTTSAAARDASGPRTSTPRRCGGRGEGGQGGRQAARAGRRRTRRTSRTSTRSSRRIEGKGALDRPGATSPGEEVDPGLQRARPGRGRLKGRARRSTT